MLNIQEVVHELEGNLLGCLLKDHSLIDEVVLSEHHFQSLLHREWYKLLMDFHKDGKRLDFITLKTVDDVKVHEMGGSRYMSDMINSVPSLYAFPTYQQSILDYHNISKAKDIATDFLFNVSQFAKKEELLSFMEKVSRLEISTVNQKENFKSRVAKRVGEHMDAPLKGYSGVNTGFETLNKLTDGWKRKDLIVLGARPSMGKTAFGLATLWKGSQQDPDVMPTFMSAEMPDGGIIDRLIAQAGNINLAKLRNINKYFKSQEEHNRYAQTVGILESSRFEVYEEVTVPAIRARMRQRIKEHPDKKHICCIDFLTQLRPINPTGNSNYDYGNMVLDIKQMAKDLNIPVILLAQLNRQNESRQDKRPTMSDIRDTGTVEQAGDIIGFLHREDYYKRDQEPTNITELIIAKNRQGRTGVLKFRSDLETQNFYDIYLEGK
ncbi:replicative DNA helicase [Peribacillus acanthi]|uniref:replicative DNA helicase n=1 Tax=Peribacillus acanthi TaxID=2171554 RepID=UPI000D3E4E6C|nr:DnaB-like helicase C-terminal domain-containing protein [Peribacillus acanthi]